MAEKICTNCGYEGRGTRKPRTGGGTPAKILGMLLMLPIYTLIKSFQGGRSKDCPNCGLPTMVKLNSDAGWIARRKMDLELGLAPIRQENEAQMFGNDASIPRTERKSVDPDQW